MKPQSKASASRRTGATLGTLALVLSLLAPHGPGLSASPPLTGAEVMRSAAERFHVLQDYQCSVEVQSDLGSRVETGAAQFWYKQPGMLRVNVTRGSKKGSVVAVDGSGKIRGHQGGLFSGIVRSMKTSDKRLLTIRGTSLLTLDWGSFYRKFQEGATRPGARVLVEPRPDVGAPYRVCLSYLADGKNVREIYSVDPQRWIMVEGAVYEGETRVEHVLFRDVKVDTGVNESWFRL